MLVHTTYWSEQIKALINQIPMSRKMSFRWANLADILTLELTRTRRYQSIHNVIGTDAKNCASRLTNEKIQHGSGAPTTPSIGTQKVDKRALYWGR